MIQQFPYRKVVMSLVLLLVVALNFTATLDSRAHTPLQDSFNRALVTFGVVRGINAVVSVVQGTEVAIEPAGVGVVLTPGELFDPVNDLIERFSWIVLAASTSLGAQLILLGVGTTKAAQVVVLGAAAVLCLLLWQPALGKGPLRTVLYRLSMLILLLRFLVPVVVLLNETVYGSFLDPQYQRSFESLEQTRQEVQALQDEENAALNEEAEDESYLSAVSRWYDRTTRNMNVSKRLDTYKAKLESASEQIVHLIVVFVLQTFVFPLLFLWLALRLGAAFISGSLWRVAEG